MSYAKGERDMVVMQHNLRARFPDGSVEVHTSALVAFAADGSTAMARTVGYTAAAAGALVKAGAEKAAREAGAERGAGGAAAKGSC